MNASSRAGAALERLFAPVDAASLAKLPDLRLVATLGALAGAALKTTSLIESLERLARHRGRVARELQREAARSSGGQILGNSLLAAREYEAAIASWRRAEALEFVTASIPWPQEEQGDPRPSAPTVSSSGSPART